MINCPLCGAPFGEFRITNTEIDLLVRCSCSATIRVTPDGRLGVVARMRRPEFVKGSDKERLRELFEIRKALLDRIDRADALLSLIETDREQVAARVREAAIKELLTANRAAAAERLVRTIDPNELLKKLSTVLGPDVIEAMLAEVRSR